MTQKVILAIATEICWSLQVLGIVVGVLLQDHDVRQSEFQQLPYHRIFIMLLLELNAPEHVLETINFQTLTAFWYVFESGQSAHFFLVGWRFFTWRLILTVPLWWLNHIQNNWFSYRLSTCLFLRKITGKTKMLKCLAFRAVFVFSQCYEKQSYCCALLTCSNFSFSNTFHILRPTKAPGFVYAWLELISHRIFIARMLAHTPQQKVWLQFIFSELKSSRRRMPIWCDAVSHLLKCTSMAVLFLLSSTFTVT